MMQSRFPGDGVYRIPGSERAGQGDGIVPMAQASPGCPPAGASRR
jgi:hypothetical protein